MTKPITFQLSLDQRRLDHAVELATVGVASGVDVLEAGTVLILSEGALKALPALKRQFPEHPIVADIKCTDGGGSEVGMMFELGASKATVMACASDATIRDAVKAAESFPGCAAMVDTMGCGGPEGLDVEGQVRAARRARDLGAHYVVLHLGYDERTANLRMVEDGVLLRWAEAVAQANLGIPIQVVGGLTLAQARELPGFGITEIVISMNLGAAPVGPRRYDQITAFSVELHNAEDRRRVTDQLRTFIQEVRSADPRGHQAQ